MQKITQLLVAFLVSFCQLNGQDFTPVVTNFSKNDYHAANQNWAAGQSDDGVMYFGNNHGLLQYDGSLWELHRMPQNKIVRSILVRGNRIYVGSFEEFGYFEKDNSGQLRYTSLSKTLEKYEMKNDEIWTILEVKKSIIFQSFTSYFTYNQQSTTGIRYPYTFLFFNNYKDKIYTHIEQFGFSFLNLTTKKVQPIPNTNLKNPVISVLKYDQTNALVVTKSNGIFLYNGNVFTTFETDVDAELRQWEVNKVAVNNEGVIVLGTIQNGITAIDKTGKKLWTINTNNILQNNTVLGMLFDKEQNLWVALDKGIALIQMNTSIRYIHNFKPSVGALYTLHFDGKDLLMGTNQGLYKAGYDANRKAVVNLKLEPTIKGQVWNISKIDKQHFFGNNENTFSYSSGKFKTISPVKGGICLKRGVINGQEVLVEGTYTELCIYKKTNNEWQFSHKVEGFVNPIRYIEIDYTGTIWASHLYQGLFAIRLTPDLRKIEHISTFNSLDNENEYNINVFSVNNRVVFTDNTRFYTFDDMKKQIVSYNELNKKLGYFSTAYRVNHFKDNLYWFILDGEAALVEVKPNQTKIIDIVHYSQFLNQTVDDYQNIIPISDKECLFTLENGLALYTLEDKNKTNNTATLQFSKIVASDDESLKNIYLALIDSTPTKLKYSTNNIVFSVFYPQYTEMNNLNFRFKLIGFDKVWSETSISSSKKYNYLPYGMYKLQVEVVTNSGFVMSKLNYKFEVLPPFYLSVLAKIIYLLLVLLSIYGIYRYILHLFQIKKEKIHSEQEAIRKKEIEKREQQIMLLEKEKLESELTVKSKEMAESTMTLIKKNEILVSIKNEIIAQKEILGSQYPNKYYDKVIRMLDENLSSEDDWAIFQTNFDRIHENFFRNLHATYPELTSNDLRFCAYLRLNLSSKDIAHLMNISLKGVEVGRYRIRKKIGLPSTKSLTEFMIEFK
jgi:DNA-binding CsgD family transcriptional regulator